MPNGRTHQVVGTLAGGGYAYARSRTQTPGAVLVETIGGMIGGNLGGRLPDVFEPALHPNHRAMAHGIAPVVAAGAVCVSALDQAQGWLRAEEERRVALREAAPSMLEQLWHALIEFLCRLGAGAAAGFVGGYGSHVALDAFTPKSCPLIC